MRNTRRSILGSAGTLLAALSLAGCVSDEDAGADGARTDGRTTEPATRTSAVTTGTATDTPAGPTPSPDTPPEPPTEAETPAETATEPATETDTPASTPAGTTFTDYSDWLPTPSAVGREHYAFQSIALEAVRERAGDLGGAAESVAGEFPVPGVESTADATHVHQIRETGAVTRGSFDRDAVATAFEDAGFTAAGSRHGYALFTDSDGASAVGDGAIVTSGILEDAGDPRPAVEAIVDAGAGEAERYPDADAVCDSLVGAMGPATLVSAHTHETGETVAGAVGGGLAYYVAPSETEIHAPVVFEAGAADEEPVAAWADDATVFLDADPTTVVSDRTVTARATVSTGDVEQFRQQLPGRSGSSGPSVPQVVFGFDYEPTEESRGRLRIRHQSGDHVAADALYVRGTGFADVADADQTEPGRWAGTVSGDGSVVAGDAVTVGVTSGFEVSVIYESTDGGVSATLGRHDGPDA